MSLSQKHSGKVLVPWFNIAEWKAVYDLIYSEDKQDCPKALEILKMWKLRTPLLSAGVEGTLIILEALLVDTNKLSSFEISHIFATSLMRFLNLCAANSDKQGTFFKTAMKNKLPKWLISLRHDIAHSHNVPPTSMLQLSLKYCLKWIKEKYWEVQFDLMSDLVIDESNDAKLEDAVYVCVHLANRDLQSDKELKKRINRLIKDSNKKPLSAKKILNRSTILLKDLIKNNAQGAANKISELLIDSLLILSTDIECDTSGRRRIPSSFLNKWTNVLNIIYEAEIMPYFIYKLFHFVCNDSNNPFYREIASLWISEIFQGLTQTDNIEDKDKNLLQFNSSNISIKNKDFVNEALEKLTPFTINFIKDVLVYNNAPEEFVQDSVTLISAFTSNETNDVDHIATINDLNFDLMTVDQEIEEIYSDSGWIKIEDIGPFQNLPLGILPHQSCNMNPILNL